MLKNNTPKIDSGAPDLSLLRTLNNLNQNLYNIEVIIVTLLVFIMVGSVSLSIINSLFITSPILPLQWSNAIFGFHSGLHEFGLHEVAEASASTPILFQYSIALIFFTSLLFLCLETQKQRFIDLGFRSVLKRIALSLAIVIVTTLLGLLSATLFPNGIIGSQRLAMECFVWSMMLGGSMATYKRKHLNVEAVQKLIRQYSDSKSESESESKLKLNLRTENSYAALSNVLIALFCLLLAYTSFNYTLASFYRYLEGGNMEFILNSSLPIGFGLMSTRFFILAINIFYNQSPAFNIKTSH